MVENGFKALRLQYSEKRYNLSTCVSSGYNHRLEKGADYPSTNIDCGKLRKYFPFYDSSTNKISAGSRTKYIQSLSTDEGKKQTAVAPGSTAPSSAKSSTYKNE